MKKESEQLAKEKGLEKTGHGLGWYWVLAVAGLIFITAGCWSAIYLQYDSTETESLRRQIQAGAQGVAGRLSQVNIIRKKVLGSFASETSLARLFQAGEVAGLKAKENDIRHMLPGALRVRLLPVGTNQPDTSVTPHMGFASIAQLRAAEQRSGVLPAEVHQFDTPQQHISLVVGVREQGTGPIAGLIHVAFPVDELSVALDSVKDYGGLVMVRQKAPDADPFALVHKGPQGINNRAADGSLPIDGSIWQVDFWASPSQLVNLGKGLMLTSGLLLVLLVATLLYLLMLGVRKALKRDQRNVLSLVESLVIGRPPKRHAAQLADMQPMLDVVYHQIKEYRVKMAKINKGTASFSGMADATGVAGEQPLSSGQTMPAVAPESVELPASIFRAYDIRGIVGEALTRDVVNLLGQSIGSEIYEQGLQTIVVGRDGREHSEELQSALIAGLQASGREVIDVGLVPTPVLYFAAFELSMDAGVMVTGSHNPKEYNGLKIIQNGESLTPEAIQGIRRRIDAGQLLQGQGSFDSQEIIPAYIERIVSDIRLARPIKLVIDCGNGAASVVAPELYRQLGCEVIELFCEVDGSFPNHHPDPGQVTEHGGLAAGGDRKSGGPGTGFRW